MKRYCLSLLALGVALAASAERQSFERYESIVERQMFGPPPEGFDPTKHPDEVKGGREAKKAQAELTKEQEKLKSAIRFSMINVTPSGETAVGFTDSSNPKEPKSYYLKEGESRDGWTVTKADPVQSSMTIVKDDVEVSLTIGGDSGKGAGKTSAVAEKSAGRTLPAGGSLGGLRARRSRQRAEEAARMEELDKKLKEREAAIEKRQEEERQAREEREAQQKAEREEQRKQLLQIQEELKRAREEKDKPKPENPDSEADEG